MMRYGCLRVTAWVSLPWARTGSGSTQRRHSFPIFPTWRGGRPPYGPTTRGALVLPAGCMRFASARSYRTVTSPYCAESKGRARRKCISSRRNVSALHGGEGATSVATQLQPTCRTTASAVEGAAAIAVTATATIPQLGFIHEDSGQSFMLDVADLFRDQITVPIAFKATKAVLKNPDLSIERTTRRMAGEELRRKGVIAAMIDQIKTLLNEQEA
jgi:hypothetical protein